MATYSKQKLSGSTNGKAIKLSGTDSAGAVTIHTAINNETDWDEVWVYCNNTSAASVKLTIEWGTSTAADGNIEKTIPAEDGLYCIIPGLILQNSLVIEAFAGTANVLLITGFVNRITA
jgi:hypothetical protein